MSVNRKVTTPEGLGATPTWCHDSPRANRLSTPRGDHTPYGTDTLTVAQIPAEKGHLKI